MMEVGCLGVAATSDSVLYKRSPPGDYFSSASHAVDGVMWPYFHLMPQNENFEWAPMLPRRLLFTTPVCPQELSSSDPNLKSE